VAGSDDKKRPPGVFASDDERAQLSRKDRQRARTQPEGHPVEITQLARLTKIETELEEEADDFDEQFTPVREVLALARTPEDRAMVIGLWSHSANQELRFRRTRNRSSEQTFRKDLDRLEAAHNTLVERITDATGKGGDNGKLGELKRRVDAWTSKMWWFVTVLVGALGTAATKLVFVTRAFDAVEARSIASADQIKILQAQVMTLQAAALSRRSHRGEPGPTSEPATPGRD
jgi:hypothetical protein